MLGAYYVPRDHQALLCWFPLIGFCQGAFALFTMYLPPLFPTLLRTTGAGFSYNIGRIAAAIGTVAFGLASQIGDKRLALLYSGCLFLPAALIALAMPEGEAAEDRAPPQSGEVISDEEQAVLEEVYRERGCSG